MTSLPSPALCWRKILPTGRTSSWRLKLHRDRERHAHPRSLLSHTDTQLPHTHTHKLRYVPKIEICAHWHWSLFPIQHKFSQVLSSLFIKSNAGLSQRTSESDTHWILGSEKQNLYTRFQKYLLFCVQLICYSLLILKVRGSWHLQTEKYLFSVLMHHCMSNHYWLIVNGKYLLYNSFILFRHWWEEAAVLTTDASPAETKSHNWSNILYISLFFKKIVVK